MIRLLSFLGAILIYSVIGLTAYSQQTATLVTTDNGNVTVAGEPSAVPVISVPVLTRCAVEDCSGEVSI